VGNTPRAHQTLSCEAARATPGICTILPRAGFPHRDTAAGSSRACPPADYAAYLLHSRGPSSASPGNHTWAGTPRSAPDIRDVARFGCVHRYAKRRVAETSGLGPRFSRRDAARRAIKIQPGTPSATASISDCGVGKVHWLPQRPFRLHGASLRWTAGLRVRPKEHARTFPENRRRYPREWRAPSSTFTRFSSRLRQSMDRRLEPLERSDFPSPSPAFPLPRPPSLHRHLLVCHIQCKILSQRRCPVSALLRRRWSGPSS